MTAADVDTVLTTAVAVAILPAPAVDPVEVAARALCEFYNHERGGCLCQRGLWKDCHAREIWRGEATAVHLAYKAAGIIPKKAKRP